MIRCSTELRNRLITAAPFILLMQRSIIRVYSGTMPAHPENAATGTRLGYITADGNPYLPATNGLQWLGDTRGAAKNSVPWTAYFQESGIAGWARLSVSSAFGLDDFANDAAVRIDISADVLGLITSAPVAYGTRRAITEISLGLAEHA